MNLKKVSNLHIREYLQAILDNPNKEYYDIPKVRYYLLSKFKNNKGLTVNKTKSKFRYVISFCKHPLRQQNNLKRNNTRQIKAHIIFYELYYRKLVPLNCSIIAIDGNYLNLNINNLKMVTLSEAKSLVGKKNPGYKHGNSFRYHTKGWENISKNFRKVNSCCKNCLCNTCRLTTHHIINHNLFKNTEYNPHDIFNLMVLCSKCHTLVHAKKIIIEGLIDENQYRKLIELLEKLRKLNYVMYSTIYNEVDYYLNNKSISSQAFSEG